MKKANIYGQNGNGGKINKVLKTTAIIKSGSTINIGDLISYSGSEVTKRELGDDVYKGSIFVISNDSYGYFAASAMLSESKVLIVYENSNTKYGTAIAVNIDGNNITSGSEFVFSNVETEYIRIQPLTADKAIVSYMDYNETKGGVIVLSVNGTSISKGNTYNFNNGYIIFTDIAVLNSSKALILYDDIMDSSKANAVIVNISGNNVYGSTPYLLESSSNSNYYVSTVSLTETKALAVYRNQGSTIARILNISGNSISAGTRYVFASDDAEEGNFIALSESKVIFAYKYNSNSNAIVFNISGNTISKGNIIGLAGDDPVITAFSSTKVIIAYNYGYCLCNIDNLTINVLHTYEDNHLRNCTLDKLNDSTVLISGTNPYSNSRREAAFLTLSKTDAEGLALKSGTSGESIDIYKF